MRETGSISAVSRATGMNYRRAGLPMDVLNRMCRQVVAIIHWHRGSVGKPLRSRNRG